MVWGRRSTFIRTSGPSGTSFCPLGPLFSFISDRLPRNTLPLRGACYPRAEGMPCPANCQLWVRIVDGVTQDVRILFPSLANVRTDSVNIFRSRLTRMQFATAVDTSGGSIELSRNCKPSYQLFPNASRSDSDAFFSLLQQHQTDNTVSWDSYDMSLLQSPCRRC